MANLYDNLYNPDILSCLANLSNDEVFTPPEVANAMLDMLPQELFTSPDTTFLDPACKSGVFLREIAKRLLKGLEPVIPDLQARTDHIFHKQLYGIAITELTAHLSRRSLYCSKTANGNYSVTHFETVDGNIRYKRIPHTWENGKCIFCGASESEYGEKKRGDDLETHAYEWIHTTKPEEIFKMKFDVIVSNPPYQLNDGGYGASAIPIYQEFVEQAKKLNPRFLSMIIPARWYTGGRGLENFRSNMLSDTHIRYICDYFNSEECFPGIDLSGGVCYFLWDRDNSGKCTVKSIVNEKESERLRPLLEDGSNTFIRFNEAVDILHKVSMKKEPTFENSISSSKPFGLRTYVRGHEKPSSSDVILYGYKTKSYIARDEIRQNVQWVDKIKVCISYAYGERGNFPYLVIGKPFIVESGACCTETYIVVYLTDNIKEAKNVMSYMATKFFRFLVLLKKNTQHATKAVYSFVPIQDFSRPWTDEELYAKYGLTDEEIAFIDSMIKPMDLDGDD